MDVRFKTHNDGSSDIEVVEFVFDTGARSVFPANEVKAGQDLTYAQAYPGEYGAFKAAQARPAEQPEPVAETEPEPFVEPQHEPAPEPEEHTG